MKCLDFRALDRLVYSIAFQEAFKINPDAKVIAAIKEGNLEYVKTWIEHIISRDMCEYSIRDLRILAIKLGIPRYTNYNKDELLVKIAQVKYAKSKDEFDKAKKAIIGLSSS